MNYFQIELNKFQVFKRNWLSKIWLLTGNPVLHIQKLLFLANGASITNVYFTQGS